MSNVTVIAIDGPSASGKGTIARELARRLGFHCLHSGVLYRLVALAAPAEDEQSAAQAAARLDLRFDEGAVYLDGEEVSARLEDEAVGARASRLAALPAVRQALLDRQRAFRRPPGLVAEGRDMGTVVFPDARVKVFLTASVEERARRRYKQLMEKGMHASLASLSRELTERDLRDSARSAAPLAAAPDARLLDSTHVEPQEVVARILAWYREAAGTG